MALQRIQNGRAPSAGRWILHLAALVLLAATPTAAASAYGPTRLAATPPTAAPASGECLDPLTAPTNDQLPPRLFQAGEIVEVYEPTIHPTLSFAAMIQHVFDRADGSVGYVVRPGVGRAMDHQKFDPSNVRKLGPWEAGAQAVCDIGDALNAELVPCTVLERIRTSNNYGVEFEKDGAVTRRIMPVARMRRFVGDPACR